MKVSYSNTSDYNANTTGFVTQCNIPRYNTPYQNYSCDVYAPLNTSDFVDYISPITTHKTSDIEFVKRCFEGYLTEDELCEKQYKGRKWSLNIYAGYYPALFIAIDDEDIVCVVYRDSNIIEEHIIKRNFNIYDPFMTE